MQILGTSHPERYKCREKATDPDARVALAGARNWW